MGNSSLVSVTKISPNKRSPRSHKIDTITIHCVVGQLKADVIGNIFQDPSVQASSNYGIGTDGKIGMYVEEKDRSWCSSNWRNDDRAITIECASDMTHPYAINDKVYKSLIELCTDICKRNGIKELKWKADKNLIGKIDQQNMTVHRWFAPKACPGDYIYERLGLIADAVNANLGVKPTATLYRVQTGAYKIRKNAENNLEELKAKGFNTYLVQDEKGLYKVQVGAYKVRKNAEKTAEDIKKAGFHAFITTKTGKAVH